MSHSSTHTDRPHLFRRYWKPAAITGAGGTALAFWFDEILMFGEEILAVIFLPLIAGVIYLFDILVFKSCMLRRSDVNNLKDKGTDGK